MMAVGIFQSFNPKQAKDFEPTPNASITPWLSGEMSLEIYPYTSTQHRNARSHIARPSYGQNILSMYCWKCVRVVLFRHGKTTGDWCVICALYFVYICRKLYGQMCLLFHARSLVKLLFLSWTQALTLDWNAMYIFTIDI